MDFQIQAGQGINSGALVFEKNENILTSIFLSLAINKGDFFQNRDFGCDIYKIRKITPSNIKLAQQYVQDALQWLIQVGRATSINVTVEQDLQNINQLDIKVDVTQPNGLIVTYITAFFPVGVPSTYVPA